MAAKKQEKTLNEEIEIPEGASANIEGKEIIIKKNNKEVRRKLNPIIEVKIQGNKIILSCKKTTKKEKKIFGTMKAHIRNMIHGVQKPFVYKLKACSGPPNSHFPMQLSMANNVLTIKNFLGEKVPRLLKLKSGVNVKITGTDITVESPDIELAGSTASELELVTNIPNKDQRIFQDGIYITEKPEREITWQIY